MNKSGKFLEVLVKQVEASILPDNFRIASNERIYNDEGIQIAEFDIFIEGKIGSTNFKWLIECRDRPSQGAAPGAWIEQLVGRKDRFAYDKVTAVSTTGFASGIDEYALQKGIELRTVSEITADDIKGWLTLTHITFLRPGGTLEFVRFIVDSNETQHLKDALQRKISTLDIHSPILIPSDNANLVSIAKAFSAAAKQANLYGGLGFGNNRKCINLNVEYPNDKSFFSIETDEGMARIKMIIFAGTLTVTKELIPIQNISRYQKNNPVKAISDSVTFRINFNDQSMQLGFHRIEESGQINLVISKTT